MYRDGKCPDHASDDRLVAGYHSQHGDIVREIVAGMDPADVEAIMSDCDGTPSTVLAFSLVLASRLRELAADGPLTAQLGGEPVVIELEDGQLVEHDPDDG